jgi:hypothetical protein
MQEALHPPSSAGRVRKGRIDLPEVQEPESEAAGFKVSGQNVSEKLSRKAQRPPLEFEGEKR